MLARCFQGLARPITRRGSLGAFKISFRLFQRGACLLPSALPVGHQVRQSRLSAYRGRLGLGHLWIVRSLLLPHLVTLPLIYNAPLAQEGEPC